MRSYLELLKNLFKDEDEVVKLFTEEYYYELYDGNILVVSFCNN